MGCPQSGQDRGPVGPGDEFRGAPFKWARPLVALTPLPTPLPPSHAHPHHMPIPTSLPPSHAHLHHMPNPTPLPPSHAHPHTLNPTRGGALAALAPPPHTHRMPLPLSHAHPHPHHLTPIPNPHLTPQGHSPGCPPGAGSSAPRAQCSSPPSPSRSAPCAAPRTPCCTRAPFRMRVRACARASVCVRVCAHACACTYAAHKTLAVQTSIQPARAAAPLCHRTPDPTSSIGAHAPPPPSCPPFQPRSAECSRARASRRCAQTR